MPRLRPVDPPPVAPVLDELQDLRRQLSGAPLDALERVYDAVRPARPRQELHQLRDTADHEGAAVLHRRPPPLQGKCDVGQRDIRVALEMGPEPARDSDQPLL